jgi:hypothetical protein
MSFNPKTLYAAVTSTGYRAVFATARSYVVAVARSGLFWISPSVVPLVGTPAVITTPIPAGGTIADGFIRLARGEVHSFGVESSSGSGAQGINPVPSEAIYYIDVWCEIAGDLIFNAH